MKNLRKITYLVLAMGIFTHSFFAHKQMNESFKRLELRLEAIDKNRVEDSLINYTSKAVFVVYNEEGRHSGTGVVIEKNNKLYMLTNNHVCEPYTDYVGYNSVTKNEFKGKMYKVDANYDLCAIEITELKEFVTPIKVAEFPKERFTHVWIMGYPVPHQLLRVDQGYRIYNQDTEDFSGEVFSFCVDHGYSGSPIFNNQGEIITLINRKDTSGADVCESYGVYAEAFYSFYKGL